MGKMAYRADFSEATRRLIAERAGYQCSVLNCGRLTVGPGPGEGQSVKKGMAAHIYAASPGGPRGTGGLSAPERSESENGIWCCYSHGKEIDSDSGNAYSATDLKAWKRLHESRKGAEVTGIPQDRFGLVESILVNSAPASLAGRKFELGMRNIITGPNGSGKTILTRLIASVADSDHVAELSQRQNVDIEVRWFDPLTRNVATSGRSGDVTHVLDGRRVPYVARPYKTILLDGGTRHASLGSLIALSQMFDLSLSAMKGTLGMLAESSDLVKQVDILGMSIDWTLDINGRTIRLTGDRWASHSMESLVLLELAGVHARYHARVEPTFLLIDALLSLHHRREQIAALQRLQTTAEHAQVAIINHHDPIVIDELSREWSLTTLDDHRSSDVYVQGRPIDIEVETTTPPPPDVS
jgi:hypothetical protein